MKPNLLLDFDGTLFDQNLFIKNYFAFLSEKYDVPDQAVSDTYEEAKNGHGAYIWEQHLVLLGISNSSLFIKSFKEHFQDLALYLYDDVHTFLENAMIRFNRVIVVTAGEKEFQSHKVKNSLGEFSFELVTTEYSKRAYLNRTVSSDIFIDNRIRNFSKDYKCQQYRILRANDKYSNEKTEYTYFKEIKKLAEIYKDMRAENYPTH